MDYFSIDYLIVYAFLITTLIIGLCAGRGIKDIREYAVANKLYGTGALILTFLATNIDGASVTETAEQVFSDGIIPVIALLGLFFTYLIMALLVAPKFTKWTHCITMGDLMGEFYGPTAKLTTGLLSFLSAMCIVGMELLVLGAACSSLLSFDSTNSIVIGGIALALYTAVGGIKAVTLTDVFQFLIVIIGVPTLATLVLQHTGGIQALIQQLPPSKLTLWEHQDFYYHLGWFLTWSIFPIGIVDPAIIQRLLMGRSGTQLRDQYLVISALDPAFNLMVMLVGLGGFVLYPHLEAGAVMPTLLERLLPMGIRGIALAGIVGLCTSTLDSYLHAAGLALTHDVLEPASKYFKAPLNELRTVRYTTFLLGIVGIFIALNAVQTVDLLWDSLAFCAPILMFPLFSAVMGLKPDKQAFYGAMCVTLVAFFVARQLLLAPYRHLAVLISVLVNGVTFFALHLINNKGFVLSTLGQQSSVETFCRTPEESLLAEVTKKSHSASSIVRYSQHSVAKYGASYILFGTFCCANFVFPYFMWTDELVYAGDLMLYIRLIGATACGLLIVKDKWPYYLLPYMPSFWHLTLLYCLPFTSTLMFLLTQGSIEWLINVAMTILFLIVLVDWFTFLILSLLGVALGFLFYRLAIGPITLQLGFSEGYLLVYQGIFATLIGLLFARRKQQRFDRLASENQTLTATDEERKAQLLTTFREKIQLIHALRHAGVQGLLQAAKLLKELHEKLKTAFSPLLPLTTQLEGMLMPLILQLRSVPERATDYLRLEVAKVALKDFLQTLQQQIDSRGIQQGIRFQNNTHCQELTCDPKRIQMLLISGITTLRTARSNATQPLLIGIENTQLRYPLPSVKEGYVKQVAALRLTITVQNALPTLQEAYEAQLDPTNPPMETPTTVQEIALLESQRIVKAHYGYSSHQADTLSYVIPIALRAVRSKDLDKPSMELGSAPVRADDTYPGAKKLENAFLRSALKLDTIDMELLQSVIELIKWYHGNEYRQSGEPFYLHPLAVAKIVLSCNPKTSTILAALLHDTVEDTALLIEDIEAAFGNETATIVDNVTKLEGRQKGFYKVKLTTEESMMMLETSGNDEAMIVKIADRLHNMRTIKSKPLAKQVQIAQETLQYHVPQAVRLELVAVTRELKQLCKEVLAGKPATDEQ